jgi:hypothetical protein
LDLAIHRQRGVLGSQSGQLTLYKLTNWLTTAPAEVVAIKVERAISGLGMTRVMDRLALSRATRTEQVDHSNRSTAITAPAPDHRQPPAGIGQKRTSNGK